MPTFPTYDGELPSCLNPWNPRHYLLVLYWVFFRPTSLKAYLYQADPKFFTNNTERVENSIYFRYYTTSEVERESQEFRDSISSEVFTHKGSAYKKLSSIAILLFLLIQSTLTTIVLIGLSGSRPTLTSLPISELNKILVDRFYLSGLLIISFLLFNNICMLFGSSSALSFSSRIIIISGVILGLRFEILQDQFVSNELSFTLLGFVILAIGSTFDSLSGVFITFIIGLLFSVISIFSVIYGKGFPTLFSLEDTDTISSAFFPFVAGILHLPFYLFQIICLFSGKVFSKNPPFLWDELGVLPLPGSTKYLVATLRNADDNAMILKIVNFFKNPFQIIFLQKALFEHLNSIDNPISELFKWSTLEQSSIYDYFGYEYSRVRNAVFAGFNYQFFSLSSHSKERSAEEIIYSATRIWCKKNVTPLTDFAGIFYRLFTHDEETDRPYDLLADRPIYTALTKYPYGTEIAESFETIGQFLTYSTLEAIATAEPPAPRTDNELRPTILQTLHDFHLVRQEIHRSIIATSRTNRLSAIALANDKLDQLQTYISTEVPSGYPEHKLLLRITRQWQKIITQAGGTAARQQLLTPVSNPYVAGNPVTGKLFVGRDDILQRIEELWTQPDQISSIVLYGHRRMGKTSILRNLSGRFGPHTHIIDFNLQRVGMIDQLSDLIYRLAIELHDALPATIQLHIPEPTEDQYYNTHNPTTQLDRLLKQIQTHRQTDRFIIAIDEFEILENLINQGKIQPEVIAYLRSLIVTYPWFILILAGLHTLQEMTENYWSPLFGNVSRIPVSTLSPAAAYPLITNPTDDFLLDYDQDSIDRIIQLSGGQPYLIQLLCQSLITRFNRIRFEERHEIEPRFTLQDVETIVSNPDFYRDGNAYFSALWNQAQETHAPTQHQILKTLTHGPLTVVELTDRIPNPNLLPALHTLLEHDVIALENNRYTYRIELLRLWVDRIPFHH